MEPHAYRVDIVWTGNRKGILSSPELETEIEITTPPQFPKGVEGVWSPEHLFTASVSSCLMTTFLSIAENSKLEFTDFSVKSQGVLEQVGGKFLMTKVLMFPEVTIAHEKDRERTERILQKSEAACLISNSVKSKIEMQAKILVTADELRVV
ncbi:MAG: OsmC family protein [Bacteroidota bacterium]